MCVRRSDASRCLRLRAVRIARWRFSRELRSRRVSFPPRVGPGQKGWPMRKRASSPPRAEQQRKRNKMSSGGGSSSGGGGDSSDLASLLECPVCFDYVLPPILQCQSGHLVCSNCRPKLNCCPTCRAPLGNIRNLAMEQVANTLKFTCKYNASGCALSLACGDKAEHEEQCPFRPYSCPCPGASCKWQGPLEQVMPHLLAAHKSITNLTGEDIVFLATDINLPGAVDWVMMQTCYGHNFMLILEKQEKFEGHPQFFAVVQIVGSPKEAKNFAYKLELNGNKRKLTYEAAPRSIHEGVAAAINHSDCLVFDPSIAKLFSDHGNLGINVTISQI
ncbi:E3 ubiquitin-protein ligase Siah1-like [Cloeon dipterum]|uniref:E3 ubiquitin-protein ligase Siah1-like n=1 Tax=Cloeon dipterum TaxID=197152 RepID=UPI00321F9E49